MAVQVGCFGSQSSRRKKLRFGEGSKKFVAALATVACIIKYGGAQECQPNSTQLTAIFFPIDL